MLSAKYEPHIPTTPAKAGVYFTKWYNITKEKKKKNVGEDLIIVLLLFNVMTGKYTY